MSHRTVCVLLLCLCLVASCGDALGQDKVTLQYKFVPGEVLRYKTVAGVTIEGRMPTGEQVKNLGVQVVAVMKQKVSRIMPNGDAVIIASLESLNMHMGDKSMKVPTGNLPGMKAIIAKSGAVKSLEGLEKIRGVIGSPMLMGTTDLGQYGELPAVALAVGDRWTQDIFFPAYGGTMRLNAKLLDTGVKLGKYTVAAIQQDMAGEIRVDIPMPVMGTKQSVAPTGMGIKGSVTGTNMIYFSAQKGKTIRTDRTADATITISASGSKCPPGSVSMTLHMQAQEILLPS